MSEYSSESLRTRSARRQDVLVASCLIALTLAVYGRSVTFDFVNYDDNPYVYENPHVLQGLSLSGLRWAFTTFTMGHWHPLTWISLMLDSEATKWAAAHEFAIGNERAGVFHLTNVLLHTANAVLLFSLLNTLTGARWRSAFVAALFAIHPLHVQSVAWVSERKDVLSTLFWFLTLHAYVRWVARPNRLGYVITVLLYGLGLMAKSMLMTLPITLLLLDFWPLGRLSSRGGGLRVRPDRSLDEAVSFPEPSARTKLGPFLIEKIPLFALALCFCALAFWAEWVSGTVAPLKSMPLEQRLANAVLSYGLYALKMARPVDLAVFYPFPDTFPVAQVAVAAIFFVTATVVAVRAGLSPKLRWFTVGWFWYVITILPVIGLVQIAGDALADHRAYVPLIGLYIVIAWAGPTLVERLLRRQRAQRAVLTVLSMVLITVLIAQTYRQVGYWENSLTLFGHTLEVTKANPIAEMNYGAALRDAGRPDEAIRHFKNAIRIWPDYFDANFALGTLLIEQNRYAEAENPLRRAVRLMPKSSWAHNNLGAALLGQRKIREAIKEFETAMELNPRNENAQFNLEQARRMLGDG